MIEKINFDKIDNKILEDMKFCEIIAKQITGTLVEILNEKMSIDSEKKESIASNSIMRGSLILAFCIKIFEKLCIDSLENIPTDHILNNVIALSRKIEINGD